MVGAEHRAHPRFDVDHEVDVARGDLAVESRMRNLSRSGTLVATPIEPPLSVGERVVVSFRVPDLDTPLRCQAEVRWVNSVDRSLVGLHFVTGWRAKEVWALGRFLERFGGGESP